MPSSSNLHEIKRTPAPEAAAGIIELLVELLAEARAGHVRSLMVVTRSTDGGAISSQWNCADGDSLALLEACLQHDILAARS